MTDTSIPTATVLGAADVAELPAEQLDGLHGVTRQVLWRQGSAEAGVLRVESGAHLGVHAHRVSHHHMWVVEGAADILGERMSHGSYAHIPHGIEHDVDATDTDGCTVLYVYAPEC